MVNRLGVTFRERTYFGKNVPKCRVSSFGGAGKFPNTFKSISVLSADFHPHRWVRERLVLLSIFARGYLTTIEQFFFFAAFCPKQTKSFCVTILIKKIENCLNILKKLSVQSFCFL